MFFKRLLDKLLFLIGIKSYRWKLAICEIKNKKVKILRIFNPGFFEFWADPFFVKNKKSIYFSSVLIIFQKKVPFNVLN